MIRKNLVLVFLFFLNLGFYFSSFSQFASPAGQVGTTAVHKDSSAIVNWASAVFDFKRGALDIANGWGALASYGDSTAALGYAEGNSNNVVALGDSGVITFTFPYPIMNGAGNDFAVFENSFSHDYLEFAFVEVSSDGINFIRFPSTSLIQSVTQTATYATSPTEQVHNLAGKYIQGYGTPFDLEDIVDSSGINLDSVLYVRIVDVIGTINTAYCSYDSQGNRINDPYPTDFESGGFDLDGVAVINENNIYATTTNLKEGIDFEIYPNPSNGNFTLSLNIDEPAELSIYDLSGQLIWRDILSYINEIKLYNQLSNGTYLCKIKSETGESNKLFIVQ